MASVGVVPAAAQQSRIRCKAEYVVDLSPGIRTEPREWHVEGDRLSRTFDIAPVEGDCVTKPATSIRVRMDGSET